MSGLDKRKFKIIDRIMSCIRLNELKYGENKIEESITQNQIPPKILKYPLCVNVQTY